MTPQSSERQVIADQLINTQNELLKLEVANRLMMRLDIKNDLNNDQKMLMGKTQESIRKMKKSIEDLKDFYREASDTPPLADFLGKDYTQK